MVPGNARDGSLSSVRPKPSNKQLLEAKVESYVLGILSTDQFLID